MQTFFISDLHFGHERLLSFTPEIWPAHITTPKEHAEYLVQQWNAVVPDKRGLVWVLGDLCMAPGFLSYLPMLNGEKRILLGNHDDIWWGEYHLPWFRENRTTLYPYQPLKWKEFWLSHCPMHPAELRGRRNIHGHVHTQTLNDPRYINVCADVTPNHAPVSLESLRERLR